MWICAIVVLAAAAAALDEERGIRTWLSRRDDLAAAELRLAEISDGIENQKVQVEALTNDPFAIERAIREELRYARKGERVIRLRRPGLATPRNN